MKILSKNLLFIQISICYIYGFTYVMNLDILPLHAPCSSNNIELLIIILKIIPIPNSLWDVVEFNQNIFPHSIISLSIYLWLDMCFCVYLSDIHSCMKNFSTYKVIRMCRFIVTSMYQKRIFFIIANNNGIWIMKVTYFWSILRK